VDLRDSVRWDRERVDMVAHILMYCGVVQDRRLVPEDVDALRGGDCEKRWNTRGSEAEVVWSSKHIAGEPR